MNLETDEKGAAVKFPPPLVFLVIIIVMYGVEYVLPIGLGASAVLKYVGILVVVLGVLVVFLASRYFKHAETNIEPWKPTTKIISSGIYGYSRNPIYLAFCLVQIGIALFLNSFWILISFMVSASLVYHIAIKKEERYLEKKFGEDYIRYKNKVRRWL
ncbi:MAG: isoprenylcysteine carboxylmethyltransferase family protein [Amphritea sp.]